jgi:hypothetical protein
MRLLTGGQVLTVLLNPSAHSVFDPCEINRKQRFSENGSLPPYYSPDRSTVMAHPRSLTMGIVLTRTHTELIPSLPSQEEQSLISCVNELKAMPRKDYRSLTLPAGLYLELETRARVLL